MWSLRERRYVVVPRYQSADVRRRILNRYPAVVVVGVTCGAWVWIQTYLNAGGAHSVIIFNVARYPGVSAQGVVRRSYHEVCQVDGRSIGCLVHSQVQSLVRGLISRHIFSDRHDLIRAGRRNRAGVENIAPHQRRAEIRPRRVSQGRRRCRQQPVPQVGFCKLSVVIHLSADRDRAVHRRCRRRLRKCQTSVNSR